MMEYTLRNIRPMTRIWHPWHLWECYRNGFFDPRPSDGSGEREYASFFTEQGAFQCGLENVLCAWGISCEHNLTNESLNRIAWLGQAAICLERGITSFCRAGFSLLEAEHQQAANRLAVRYLKLWLEDRGYEPHKAVYREVEAEGLSRGSTRPSTERTDAAAKGTVIQGYLFGNTHE